MKESMTDLFDMDSTRKASFLCVITLELMKTHR